MARRIGGEQEIIARYEPDRAVETLPALLPQRQDRKRLLTLLERLANDRRVQHDGLDAGAAARCCERVRAVLGRPAAREERLRLTREKAHGPPHSQCFDGAHGPQGLSSASPMPTASPTAARSCAPSARTSR